MDIYTINKKETDFIVTISDFDIDEYVVTITNVPIFTTINSTHPLNQNITLTN